MAGRKKGKPGPDLTDVQVGLRIKTRRMELGLSQTGLADGLDISFQQVQKYEKGRNRVGASRLTQIANLLKVTQSYFFDQNVIAEDGALKNINMFAASKDGGDLIQAMTKIRDKKLRHQIAKLVEDIADTYYGDESRKS